MAKRESSILRFAGMNLPKVRSALFCLFQVRISPPLRPPPSKIVSSFITASAGPREFPPSVTALDMEAEVRPSETKPSLRSAALLAGALVTTSTTTNRILAITLKPYSERK